MTPLPKRLYCMPKNRYYHYDHETCSFVEVKPSRTRMYVQLSVMAVSTLALAALFTLGLDRVVKSPQELALQEENQALQAQLDRAGQRIQDVAVQLENLSATDQNLYRLLLQADPISPDVRQVGVGGTDPYVQFDRFSSSTADLLRQTAQQLDQLERQISLQQASYQELSELARDHEGGMRQLPAILPANGPVISGFGMRRHPVLKIIRMHPGVDLAVNTGTPVYVTGDGVVEKAEWNVNGYGLHVVVRHEKAGYKTLYAHLSKIPKDIRPGRTVKRGDQIGFSGNTGLSKGPHLHYEVHDLEGRKLNPIRFFAPSMTPQQYQALLIESENTTVSMD